MIPNYFGGPPCNPHIGSNVKDIKAEQLRESVSEALKEGCVIMGTVFQELLDRGKEEGIEFILPGT